MSKAVDRVMRKYDVRKANNSIKYRIVELLSNRRVVEENRKQYLDMALWDESETKRRYYDKLVEKATESIKQINTEISLLRAEYTL